MARLNEFGASTETVESLKRRFVRQNREIARANSLQSVRVKDLEAEVSRLLAENVSLREEVISLKQELESFQGSERVDAGVSCIKDKLEAKLAEISSIVTDLGTLPRRRPAAVPSRSLPDNPDQPVSPTDNHAMPAVRATRDPPFGSDLPVILEDKLYPRLSLESDHDIDAAGNLEEGETQLDEPQPYEPSNGPEDPKEQPHNNFSASDSRDDASTHIPESPPSLEPNLEMRKKRKRRDSSLIKDIVPKADFEPTDHDIGQPPLPKTGSKRKFTVNHDEDPITSHQDDGSDDFHFTRVTEQQPRRPAISTSSGAERPPSQSRLKESNIQPRKKDTAKSIRRALEPKSTNIGPKSPAKGQAKTTALSGEEKDYRNRHEAPEKPEKPKRVTKTGNTERRSLSDKPEPKRADIHLTDDAPISPKNAGEDFPNETLEPNAASKKVRSQNSSERDGGIESLESDGNQGEGMRHSRRSRGAVNYAEPNLRVKMRRPAEDPGDAATGNDSRRISKSHGDQVSGSGQQAMDCEERRTAEQDDLDSGVIDAHDRKGDSVPGIRFDSTEREMSQDPLSSAAISTMDTKRRTQDKRRSVTKRKTGHQQFPLDDFEESSIFSDAGENSVDGRDMTKQSRRHSSNPSYNAGGSTDSGLPNRTHLETVAAATTEGRRSSNRSGNSKLNNQQAYHRVAPEIQDGPVGSAGRTQRLGTRRRSTMV